MFKLVIILIFFFIVVAFFTTLSKAKRSTGTKSEPSIWPYFAKSLLTEREQAMFHRLREAFPNHIILSQVALSQVIAVKPRTANAKSWFYKISQKSLDFVICRLDTCVLAAIELDDSSHDNAKQKARDADKDKALQDAGVKLLRFRKMPSKEVLTMAINRLESPSTLPITASKEPAENPSIKKPAIVKSTNESTK